MNSTVTNTPRFAKIRQFIEDRSKQLIERQKEIEKMANYSPIDDGFCVNLTGLSLKSEDFEGILGVFERNIDFKQVSLIDISHNCIEEIPEFLAEKFPNLVGFHAGHNPLLDVRVLTECPDLQVIDLQDVNLLAFPAYFKKCPNLKTLTLDNSVSRFRLSEISENLGQMPKLRQLSVNFNEINSLPLALDMPELRWLSLTSNQLTDASALFAALSGTPRLERLWLKNNQLTVIPDSIKALTKLKTLDLRGNPIVGIASKIPDKCPLLHEILISESQKPVFKDLIPLINISEDEFNVKKMVAIAGNC
jgi:Leucine-rich repeat (LRR) protein